MNNATRGKQRSSRSLEWLNFFLADVQTGLGPFLAAYAASGRLNPGRVGYASTFKGWASVATQTSAVSTSIGGMLMQHLGYRASFLGLAGIAVLAFRLLWFAIPETLSDSNGVAIPASEFETKSEMKKEFPAR